MTAALRRLWFIGLVMGLQACSSSDGALPTPLEPDQNSIAYFCHMSLPEHEGPKGQAFMRGKDKPIWFASASEAFVYLETELFQPGDLRILYVNDMSKGTWEQPAAGAWIDIHKAVFVLGSSQITAMGDKEAVPFATREAAAAFINQYGGAIADFDAAAKALAVERAAGDIGVIKMTMPIDGRLSRRRVLSILAAGAALPVAASLRAAAAPLEPFRWQGIALGAAADLTLYASDRGEATGAIEACLAELARLEAIFSLHRPDSALSRLNRQRHLAEPPAELVELLAQALLLGRLSEGRFDPTIQPLWTLIADHFTSANADPAGPDHAKLAAAQALVDYRAIELTEDRIALTRPGMQVSLNGIAQGYISDRVGALLKARGFHHALVNLGETLAIDRRADGRAWRIGIPAPADRSRLVTTIDIDGGAVATSAGRGLLFEATGRFNHIIDPKRLACADPDRSVTVIAAAAAAADGLSTWGALAADPVRDLAPHLARFGARAFVINKDRQHGEWLG